MIVKEKSHNYLKLFNKKVKCHQSLCDIVQLKMKKVV